ncbi:unnamed protein product [Polarella glacialis]|uniref:Uncharacterized protein n=1 Tax=Polarella glacialis TaxID=89957 RepID=A0A813I208_POLGL|nr:unnamed protein product [Polarella glacialis]
MFADEQLSRSIAMLVAEQCDKQVVALFAELQHKLFANVESAVLNQLVDGRTDTHQKSSCSSSTAGFATLTAASVSLVKSRTDGQSIFHVPAQAPSERSRSTPGEVQPEDNSEEVPQESLQGQRQSGLRVTPVDIDHSQGSGQGQRQSSLRVTSVDDIYKKRLQRKTSFSPMLEVNDGKHGDDTPPVRLASAHLLFPATLELSAEQEVFRCNYRQFRMSEALAAGELKEAEKPEMAVSNRMTRKQSIMEGTTKFDRGRGLINMERALVKTLRSAEAQVCAPQMPPPRLEIVPSPSACKVVLSSQNSSVTISKPKTMSQAWAEQDKALAGKSDVSKELHIGTPFWLCIWGFRHGHRRRWISRAMSLYTAAILCCIGVAMASQLWRLRDPMSKEGRYGNEVILVMGFGSAACIFQLFFQLPGRDSAIQVTSAMLMDEYMLPKFVDLWLERSQWSSWEAFFFWFLSVAIETGVVLWTSDKDNDTAMQEAVHLTAFAVVAGAFSALSLYVLHMCNAQAAMIDNFSATAAETSDDYRLLRQDWDKIQATLRRSAQGLTPVLLTLTFTPLLIVVFSAIELLMDNDCDTQRILLELLPKMIVLMGAVRGFCRIGEVTGNCERLPVFLNSLLLGDAFDQEASHLIDFIERSKSGFYAFEAKVDFASMSKIAYVFGAGLLALLSQAVQL